MNLVIKHQNTQDNVIQNATFITEVPDRATLMDMVASGTNYLGLSFGLSLAHPKDNYNKKTGRELAKANLGIEAFELSHISFRDFNRTVFHFTGNVRNRPVMMAMSFIPGKNTRLEYVYL